MIKRQLTFFLLVLCAFSMSAANFEIDGIWYETTSDQTVRVIPETNATDGSGTFIIFNYPYEGDLTIPSSVTYGSVTYTVTAAKPGTFRESSKLVSVSLPATLTDLGEAPFASCSRLEAITVAEENPAYTVIDGLLYDKTGSTLLACPGAREDKVTIASSATTIGASAFHGCSKVTSVDIPTSVTSIGEEAFRGCKKLSAITLPGTLTTISDRTFYNCQALHTLTLPETITSIGENAFYQCISLNRLTLPASLRVIGDYAFSLCSGLSSVTLPQGLQEIGFRAFENCIRITSITIPSSVNTIATMAFCGCSNLNSINVAGDNKAYSSQDGVLFNKSKTTLLCCPSAKSSSYVVPSTVNTIGEYGFYACKSLTSITLPHSLTILRPYSFRLCTNLKTIALPPTVSQVGKNVFNGCNALQSILLYAKEVPNAESNTFTQVNLEVPLYVPAESVESYKSADFWKDIISILPLTEEVVAGKLGDVNSDDKVNVTDVMQTVNVILGNPITVFSWQMADLNFDGLINVTDIMKIVNIILND